MNYSIDFFFCLGILCFQFCLVVGDKVVDYDKRKEKENKWTNQDEKELKVASEM